jgi:hypothetical protein
MKNQSKFYNQQFKRICELKSLSERNNAMRSLSAKIKETIKENQLATIDRMQERELYWKSFAEGLSLIVLFGMSVSVLFDNTSPGQIRHTIMVCLSTVVATQCFSQIIGDSLNGVIKKKNDSYCQRLLKIQRQAEKAIVPECEPILQRSKIVQARTLSRSFNPETSTGLNRCLAGHIRCKPSI